MGSSDNQRKSQRIKLGEVLEPQQLWIQLMGDN